MSKPAGFVSAGSAGGVGSAGAAVSAALSAGLALRLSPINAINLHSHLAHVESCMPIRVSMSLPMCEFICALHHLYV